MLIIFLGLILRQHNLYTWPRTGATFDEYAWTWLGISIIKNHYPESWSPHKFYTQRKEIRYQNTPFVLVKPYLEHPPLFGIVAGGFALLNGAESIFDIDVSKIRGLALLLGNLSIFLVYLLTSRIYDTKTGLLAAFLYAIVPTVAIGSRLVQNENFFIPSFLLALFCIKKYLITEEKKFRNIAAVVCGLLSLAKVPWIAASLAVILIFFYNRRYKDSILFLSLVIPIFSLFLIYGLLLDKDLFIKLWTLQLNRYDITFDGIFALFTTPYLADRFLLDGWIYMGWFSYFILLTKNIKKNIFVVFPLFAYFVVYVFGIPNESGHGWYRYPFYPFLIISLAVFLRDYFNKNYLLTFFFLLFTSLSLLHVTWGNVFGFSFIVFRFILIIQGIGILPLFFSNKRITNFSNRTNMISFCFVILLSVWTILSYNEQ